MLHRDSVRSFAWSVPFVLGLVGAAHAQCLDWRTGFSSPGGGVDQTARAEVSFDDGHGAALFVGGDFLFAGGAPANHIARWDGSSWSALGQGLNGAVLALSVYDAGSGPALYAAGSFTQAGGVSANHIARWNGSSWSAVGGGTNGDVSALTIFNDGTGTALFAGGSFTQAGGLSASRIAKWNGSSWSSLGSGTDADVKALTVFNDGFGSNLYAGGAFTLAGGQAASHVARWSGASWTALGAGTDADVLALTVSSVGGTPTLYAGGMFLHAGGVSVNYVARWNGLVWSALVSPPFSPGVDDVVYALADHDVGNGVNLLYIGGLFVSADDGYESLHHVALWDGSGLSSLGTGANGPVHALASHDDGTGPALYAGGAFTSMSGAPAGDIASWRPHTWSSLSHGNGMSDDVHALAVFGPGSPALYAGGRFTSAGGVNANYIAKWNGSVWSPLDTGMFRQYLGVPEVGALATYDIPSPALYAGGRFDQAGSISSSDIARWDGTSWSSLAGGMDASPNANHFVSALVVFDDGSGPALVAGGMFTSAGGVPAIDVARWNGSSWSPFGAGLGMGNVDSVSALAVYDDGAGPALYAGGSFTTSGGNPLPYLAKWNGSSWTTVGSGLAGNGSSTFVDALTVFDDGSGPKLYAGGRFTSAGGTPVNNVARWNGSSWSAFGGGVSGSVYTLGSFDDGSGPALYVGGGFTTAGGGPANGIARWNGTSWSQLSSGVSIAFTQTVFDDGSGGGPDLYLGGTFDTAGGLPSQRIGEWRGCAGTGARFCFGDGSSAACPCGNSGGAEHGCQNSIGTGGSLLSAAGQVNPDSVVLTATGELPSALSIFLQGTVSIAPTNYGDGLRCTGGSLRRLFAKSASGGVVVAPQPGDPSITSRSAALGDPISPGATRVYQVYYRDPNPSFCPAPTGSTFNVSNGVRIVW
jgi:hypothetical protein